MRSSCLRWLTVALAVAALAGLCRPAPAADASFAGVWKLIVTAMPEGVDHTMFLVKIETRGGTPKGLMLTTPVEKFENTVVDEVLISDRKMSFVLTTGDRQVPAIPVVLFAPEGDGKPERLLGSCDYERQRVFIRAERTKDFTIAKDKAITPLPGIADLRKAQKTGFSAEKESILKEIIAKYPDLPIVYYARLELVNVMAAAGAPDAEINAEIDRAGKFAERYDPTMRPTVVTQGLLAEAAGLKVLLDGLKRSNKATEAKAVEDRLAALEETVLAEEEKAAIPFKVKPFAGRKTKGDRVVVVELFTGTSCPPCVAADVAFDAAKMTYKPADVIFLEYHLHIPAPDPMTVKDGEKRGDFYEVGGTPTLLINGKAGPPIGGSREMGYGAYSQLTAAINSALEAPGGVKLTLKAQRQGDQVEMQAQYADLKTIGKDVKLRFLVVEERVRFAASNGQKIFHQVVRGFAGGVEGTSLMDNKGEESRKASLAEMTKELRDQVEEFNKMRPFTDADKPLELKRLKVVALIQNDKTHEIYQAAQVDLADPR